MIDEQVERIEQEAYKDGKQEVRDEVLGVLVLVEEKLSALTSLVEDLGHALQRQAI